MTRSPNPSRTLACYLKRTLPATLLVTGLLASSVSFSAAAALTDDVRPSAPSQDLPLRGGVSVGTAGSQVIPHLSLRNADLRDILYSLSEQGGFNLIVDSSVNGKISMDLKNVSINKVLEYIMTLADLTYYKDGANVIVTTHSKGDQQNLNKLVLKSVPVRYSNAVDLANVLTNTVFSANRPGGNKNAIATADARTNSLLIMGNQQDIDLATKAIQQLDFPLQHKTFFLRNARAADVANTIAKTLFSVNLSMVGGSSQSSGSTNGSTSSSSNTNTLTTSGTNTTGGSTNTTSTPGSATGPTSGAGAGIQILKGGSVTFIANPLNNTLTLIGSAEQIQMAEDLMYDADVRIPQVAIQCSVIELDETRNKSYAPFTNSNPSGGALNGIGSIGGPNGGLGFNSTASTLFWNKNGLPGVLPSSQIFSGFGLNASYTQTKGKILANPTVLAVSGSNSTINVTNDVYAGNQTTTSGLNGILSSTPIIKQVGITLQITPTVLNDGTVELQLTPTVSAPSGTATDSTGNLITLIATNTLNVGSARVHDGQTLVLGGIIRETNSASWTKIPFLGDLPILGAIMRTANSNNVNHSELIVLVTPHIIKEEGVPYFRKEWQNSMSYVNPYNSTSATASDPGASPPNTMVPAANRGPGAGYGNGVQTLENRPSYGSKPKSSSTSLPNYTDVLK